MRMHSLGTAIATVALVACGSCGSTPGPRVEPPAPPAGANDAAYEVLMPQWRLIGDAVTPGQDALDITVIPPEGVDYVDVWVAGRPGIRLDGEGELTASIPIGDLAVGTYDVLLAADGSTTAFAKLPLYRSHPYYVTLTTDWDFSEPSQQALDRQDRMHETFPSLKITHFIGPYSFTDPEVTEARRAELAAWAIRMRDTYGDEIGLHIHPYCNFVEDAGVTCITDQSTVYANDPTGYTIKVSAYGETDFATLLAHADQLFMARGMGKPTTFRAGGWTASIETLRALEATGYVADTSANNWMRMEEWIGQGNGELYRWNMASWSSIGDTSQPYYPNHDDILATTDPRLTLLEVPDNSIMVDYVTVDEMKSIFAANWDGTPLAAPKAFMMGFHPGPQFQNTYHLRVNGILDHCEQHLAAIGAGPVVYTTLNQLPAVFER
jgi:hypothetical protein